MMMGNRKILLLSLCSLLTFPAVAQDGGDGEEKKIIVSGSVQSDILIPQKDKAIGADEVDNWALTNTYADVNVMSSHFDGGARFEFLKYPLPGYEDKFKGWGVPNIYIKAHYDKWNLTAGSFYEQFGSGFILRTYEERSLGVDNSLFGARLVVNPVSGLSIKALSGKQRRYWSLNDSWVSGADVELNLDQWLKGLSNNGTYLTLGASWVNKYESDEDIMTDATHKLNLPLSVNAFDVRASVQTGNLNVLAEYAWKTQDPSFDNEGVS